MYNEERKQRYISEKNATTVLTEGCLERVFEKTRPFEEQYDRDIADFSFHEIRDMYKVMGFDTIETLGVFNSHLRNYTAYCLSHNMVKDCQNHFIEIDRMEMLGLIDKLAFSKKIFKRKDIDRIHAKLVNPSDRFLIEALFNGINGDKLLEIAKAKMSDIEGNVFTSFLGNKYYVTDKFVQYAYESNNTLEYYSIGCKGIGRKFPLVEDGFIIKSFYNTSSSDTDMAVYQRMVKRFMRISNYCDIDINSNDIVMSGIIEYINMRCKELGISGYDYLYNKKLFVEIEDRFHKPYRRNNLYLKYKDYLEK